MSVYCTLQGENLSAHLSRMKIDVGENDLSGWPNLMMGLITPEEALTNSERRTLMLFFGSANIQINSVQDIKSSNVIFELNELFSIKINGSLYVYHSRENNNITISRIDSTLYSSFMQGHRYEDRSASAIITSSLLMDIQPELVGSFLSSRWPMCKTQIFAYKFGLIPMLILWGKGLYWYGIRGREDNAGLQALKWMTFNYICNRIVGYSDRRFLTYKSETCFTVTKCSICMEQKMCTSLCGQVNTENLIVRIPEHNVTIIDSDCLRSTSEGVGHMVCSDCKARWRFSSAGQGCPICRKHLEVIQMPSNIDFNEKRTAFFMYMLVKIVYINMLPPQMLNIDDKTVSVLKRIIEDFPRSEVMSLSHYQQYINRDQNKYVGPFDTGMLFGYFGGLCIDLDYMLYRKSIAKRREIAIIDIGLDYLRTFNRSLNHEIYSYDVHFSGRAYNLISGKHVSGIRMPNAFMHWQARRSLTSIEEEREEVQIENENNVRFTISYGDDISIQSFSSSSSDDS